MAKLCKCGAIVDRRCFKCYPVQNHDKTTAERGYGSDHRRASERYRAERPLCECCVHDSGPVGALPAVSMHHIYKIRDHKELRMDRGNWLAVCNDHHEQCERDVGYAMKVKRWTDANYESILSDAR